MITYSSSSIFCLLKRRVWLRPVGRAVAQAITYRLALKGEIYSHPNTHAHDINFQGTPNCHLISRFINWWFIGTEGIGLFSLNLNFWLCTIVLYREFIKSSKIATFKAYQLKLYSMELALVSSHSDHFNTFHIGAISQDSSQWNGEDTASGSSLNFKNVSCW